MKAILALEDGTVFVGKSVGAAGEVSGEVVFNTGMTGYQEILTDPSYAGQIVTMTYPLIGNYGVCQEDFESRRPHARGFVVRELCRTSANWRATGDLGDFLITYGIVGIEGIDTRALTKTLRSRGAMKGVLSTENRSVRELVEMAQAAPDVSGRDFVREVTTSEVYEVAGSGRRVVVLDMGCKENIVRSLSAEGCHVIVVPAWTSAEAIQSCRPSGVVISNGPGDPKDVPYAVETIRRLMGRIPIFGICLGHQLLGLALGGDTYKLKFGHRGANHPVKDLINNRVYITSQNHGYVVAEDSLSADEVFISQRNLNDGTVEGLTHKTLPLFSVQYHPEASPGPQDSDYLFRRFYDMMR